MVDDVKAFKNSIDKPKKPMTRGGLSTGSTLLNLACSGNPNWGFARGGYYLFVGKSNSGKTWLSIATLAEASINRNYKDYRLIYDGPEGGAKMDMRRYFASLVDRIEPPSHDKEGQPNHSSTIEEFYDHLDDACELGRPFVYVLDSMDALSSEDEESKAKKNKSIRRRKKNKEKETSDDETKIKGSYGDGKAKKNSANLRRFLAPLEKTGSILLIINQTRSNIGSFVSHLNPDSRSGGHALEFYANVQIWSSIREKMKKAVRGKPRHIGNLCRMAIKRSRFTGRDGIYVDVPITFSAGVDDIGSCIDWLVEERYWKKQGGNGKQEKGYKGNYRLTAPEFDFDGKRDDLKAKIEEEGIERHLKSIVQKVWEEIEEECTVKQKNKYAVKEK